MDLQHNVGGKKGPLNRPRMRNKALLFIAAV